MFYALDRFEGALAVLQDDDGRDVVVPRDQLPPDARTGDVFTKQEDRYLPCPDEAARRRQQILALQQRLQRKPDGFRPKQEDDR